MTESIVDILSQGRDREAQASKIYGLVIGLVTNNKDPDKLGRVKVKFPWLDEDVESWWARIAYPMGGAQRGFWWIPEINDEVLVGFEHGDVRHPYIVGTLYNGQDTPPKADDITSKFAGQEYSEGSYSCSGRDFNDDGNNDLRFIRSRSGHLLILDDKGGAEKITIADKTGQHRIEIFTDKKKVVITSEDGDIELIAGGTVKICCDKLETHSRTDTTMKVDANMELKVGSNLTVKAGQSVKQEAGLDFNIKAGTDLKEQGGISAEIKATTIDIKADAQLSEKAPMVQINGDAMTQIKGGIVMIN